MEIKVKYVDFYKGFIPKEHWSYKLLAKKYQVTFSEHPDYLFFSCFGNEYLAYDCIRIFISNEAVYPNLNLYDYSVTYADFKITDRLLPNLDAFEDLKYLQLAENRQKAKELLSSKEGFCSFVYSNEMGDPFRIELFNAVSRYKTVSSGGRLLNNIGYKVHNLDQFQSRFKFSIACENSWYKGYTTEKIVNAFNAGCIPIYWGNPDISKIINPGAIINCHDFLNLESVVEEIKRLDRDDEACLQKLTEPILVNNNLIKDYLKEREEFIYHIIDQPYTEAFRRNRGLRGQFYNDWFCHMLGYENEWFSSEKGYFVKKRKEIEQAQDGPLVSILIPVYNCRENVKEAVGSALNQTYSNIEIIVVDNCSTDGTYEELQKRYGEHTEYAGLVRLYQNETNIGEVNNWRVCLEKSGGKYVKMLWPDDLISSGFIGSGVNVMEKDDTVGMVFSSDAAFKGNNLRSGYSLYKLENGTGRYNRDVFYKGMFQDEIALPVSLGRVMLRREDLAIPDDIPNRLGINCNVKGAGIDMLTMLQVLERYENFYFFDDILSFFRKYEGYIEAREDRVREHNLAKLFFCKNSDSAKAYMVYIKMQILRDENVTDEETGVEVLNKYMAWE